MEKVSPELHDSNEYLIFELGTERYAIAVMHVEVVLELPFITRVPKCPTHLRGVINHRGTVVPVVDLKAVFHMGMTDLSSEGSIIITQIDFEGEKVSAGVLADSVHEVIDINPSDVESTPPVGTKIDSSYLSGIAKKNNEFIIILDLEKVLSLAVGDSEA